MLLFATYISVTIAIVMLASFGVWYAIADRIAAQQYAAPFKSIWLVLDDGTDLDISETIARIQHKRAVGKENEISFTVEQRYTERLSDVLVSRGQTIKFQYGFRGGKKSVVHRARIVEISHKYSNKIQMQIKARDTGTVMKKTTSAKVWQNVTTSQICREIAARYDLTFVGDETDYVWNNYPQSQKSDWGFLREIVAKESNGNYYIYVDDGKLILERRALDQQSVLNIEFGNGTRVKSLDIRIQEKNAGTSSAGSTTFLGFDPNEGEIIGEKADPDNESENVLLDEFKYVFSADGDLKSEPEPDESFFANIAETGERVVTNLTDATEIKSEANHQKKAATLRVTTATLKIVGEPNLSVNSVLTLSGVLKIHLGNYLIVDVTDDVGTSGYLTTLKLEKNAGRRANRSGETAESDPTKVNKSVGGDAVAALKEIFVFDANGNLKSEPKTQYKAPD